MAETAQASNNPASWHKTRNMRAASYRANGVWQGCGCERTPAQGSVPARGQPLFGGGEVMLNRHNRAHAGEP